MKINIRYEEYTEKLQMRLITDYDPKDGRFKKMIVNFGGRHLPF